MREDAGSGSTRLPRVQNRNERGTLSLPFGILVLIAFTTSLSLIGLLRKWESLTHEQLILDRCVGEMAQKLKSAMRGIEASNRRVIALRAAIVAADAIAGASATLRILLQAEEVRRKTILWRWTAQYWVWKGRVACGAKDSQPIDLSDLPWAEVPPDSIGARPLQWPRSTPKKVFLQNRTPHRASAARVEARQEEWAIAWVLPQRTISF